MKVKELQALLVAAYRRGWRDAIGDVVCALPDKLENLSEPYTSEVKQSLADDGIG